jgi:hypothetical protein
MYVLEYFIYHLRAFGIGSTSTTDKDALLETAYQASIQNMGADDVFKKNLTDWQKLIRAVENRKLSSFDNKTKPSSST